MGGFFGVVAANDCGDDLYYGTDYHSHLGTQRGGLAVQDGRGIRRVIHDIRAAQFRSKFDPDRPRLRGRRGIGVISDFEDQPLLIRSHLGLFAIVTVGVVRNLGDLAAEVFARRGGHFAETSGDDVNPTEVVASIIASCGSFAEGLALVQERVEGSCSLLLLTGDGIYAARDRLGRTPVVLGEKDGARAVTLESCAFPNLDYRPVRDLGPGEAVLIDERGVHPVLPPRRTMQICSFLWIYYGYPASTYEGRNVEDVRNRCGACLARRERLPLDFVAGIPDSGVAHGLGYAAEARLPYRRPFVKYTPTWPRSFMPQSQDDRDQIARMKLLPVPEIIRGARMLFCEDSIVRGTQLKDTIRRLFDAGAREVHMRPACPPLLFGCPFLNFSRSRNEFDLIARRAVRAMEGHEGAPPAEYLDPDSDRHAEMCRRIGAELGLTSVRYQRLDDMVSAIGLPHDRLCTYCWDGRRGPGSEG